jgi:hypothetical protein
MHYYRIGNQVAKSRVVDHPVLRKVPTGPNNMTSDPPPPVATRALDSRH